MDLRLEMDLRVGSATMVQITSENKGSRPDIVAELFGALDEDQTDNNYIFRL